MKKAAIVVLSLMLGACGLVEPIDYISPVKTKELNVSQGLEDDFDDLFSGAKKYETDDYVGYRVHFGVNQYAERFFDNLRGAVVRTCRVHNVSKNGLYLFYSGGPEIQPIRVSIPDSELPLPPKTETRLWPTEDYVMQDIICAEYDDETSYPSKKTMRSLEYIKVLREYEERDPADDRVWSNGYGHVILLKPHFVFEQMILPTQKEYEENYIQMLEEAKTIVGALEGDLQDGVNIRVVLKEDSDKHQVQFVVDNESGTTPIKLKLSSVGDLQIGNTRYSATWKEYSNGNLIVSFDWTSNCSPVENNHYIAVNPSLKCLAKLPVEIKGAKFTLDKNYSISIVGKNVRLKPISKYDLIRKHPTVFNEAP